MENLTSAEAMRAILPVLALDTFGADLAGRRQIVGAPGEVPPVQAAVQAAVQAEGQAEIDRAEGRPRPMVGIERFALYDLARRSYAVIHTGGRRFCGCFMLR
jgi:L-fucose mutarotase